MDRLKQTAVSAVITGSVASVVSTGALAALARAEGKNTVAPTNSTSHWLHGENAARGEADAAHTLVGYLTHHASAVFWAFPFELWLAEHAPRKPLPLLGEAAAMSAIAAAVDYGLTPKRLTPGWELVLSKRSLVATYGAMAAGLAAGALLSRRWRAASDGARPPVSPATDLNLDGPVVEPAALSNAKVSSASSRLNL